MPPINVSLQKTQTHIDWLKQKLFLDSQSSNAKKRIIKRGQVYEVELGMGVGSEIQKCRPCLIYQNDIGNIKSSKTIVIPISHTKKDLGCLVPFTPKLDASGNILLDGFVNVSEIRAVDKARIQDYKCNLENSELKDVDAALARNLDIYKHYTAMKNKYNDKTEYADKLNNLIKDIKTLLNVEKNEEILTKIQDLLDNID